MIPKKQRIALLLLLIAGLLLLAMYNRIQHVTNGDGRRQTPLHQEAAPQQEINTLTLSVESVSGGQQNAR